VLFLQGKRPRFHRQNPVLFHPTNRLCSALPIRLRELSRHPLVQLPAAASPPRIRKIIIALWYQKLSSVVPSFPHKPRKKRTSQKTQHTEKPKKQRHTPCSLLKRKSCGSQKKQSRSVRRQQAAPDDQPIMSPKPKR